MEGAEANLRQAVTQMADRQHDEIGQVGRNDDQTAIEDGEEEFEMLGDGEGEEAAAETTPPPAVAAVEGQEYAEDETWQALLDEQDEEDEGGKEEKDDDYCPIKDDEEEEEEPEDLDFEAEKEEQEREEEEEDGFDPDLEDDYDDAGPKRKKGKKTAGGLTSGLLLGKEEGPISSYSPSTLAAEIFSVTIKKKMGGPTCDPDFAKKKRKGGSGGKKKQPAKKRKNAWDSPPQGSASSRKKSANKLLPDLMHRSITAIPMSSVPVIFSRVLKALPPSDYDIYEIQNLIVTYALDEATYGGENAEERIYEEVMRLVTSDKKFLHRHVPVGHSSFSHVQTDAAMLKKYEAFLNSPGERSKRRDFLSEGGSARHGWTEEELDRYETALKESGGNIRVAARLLGVTVDRMHYFMFFYRRILAEQNGGDGH